jgi:hypothetical protein
MTRSFEVGSTGRYFSYDIEQVQLENQWSVFEAVKYYVVYMNVINHSLSYPMKYRNDMT